VNAVALVLAVYLLLAAVVFPLFRLLVPKVNLLCLPAVVLYHPLLRHIFVTAGIVFGLKQLQQPLGLRETVMRILMETIVLTQAKTIVTAPRRRQTVFPATTVMGTRVIHTEVTLFVVINVVM